MWTRLDLDEDFSMFDELRRTLDRIWGDFEPDGDAPGARAISAWPKVNAFDTGQSFVLEADVPGMTQKDLSITVNESTLTLQGERKSDAPEGHSVHRQEREGFKFSRTFTLPFKADPERSEATVKDGVLTVTLAKTKEAVPRQITVRAN